VLSGLSDAVNWLRTRLLRTADDRDEDDGLSNYLSLPLSLYFSVFVYIFVCLSCRWRQKIPGELTILNRRQTSKKLCRCWIVCMRCPGIWNRFLNYVTSVHSLSLF